MSGAPLDWERLAVGDGWVRDGKRWTRRSRTRPGVVEEWLTDAVMEHYRRDRGTIVRSRSARPARDYLAPGPAWKLD
jgi:hypothetical protein